ncbi:MAG TPA: addiction module toxin RelE [Mucilaginibacter sp.]|jgi:mRNA-degrading endonuclease RelE of RelBE toxin-antitoxin system|nr:addiction module toxin RelE [Mucilaginibacter sp.]
MNFTIKITRHFEKDAKPLIKKYPSFKSDVTKLIHELETNPTLGTPLGHNLFKIRIAISSKGKGKSGGARVITYVVSKNETVNLISIYDKAEYDTADIDILLGIVKSEGLE